MRERKTSEQAMADLRTTLRTSLARELAWLQRNAWWLRLVGGVYIAALAGYLIVIGEDLSVGMLGVLLVWAFWPRRR